MKKAILILLCVLLLPVAYACEPADIPVPDDPIVILRDDLRVLTEDFLIPGNHDYFKDMDYYFEELKFLKQEYADRAGTQMTVTLFGREHTGDFCGHLTMGMAVAKDVITQECMPCYCSPEGFLFYYSEKAGRVVHFYSRKEFVELLREERPDAEELTVQQISDNCIKAFEAEYGLNGWVEINCEPSKYIRSGYKFTFGSPTGWRKCGYYSIGYQHIRRNAVWCFVAGTAGGAFRQRADPQLAGGNVQGADPKKTGGALRGIQDKGTAHIRSGLYGRADSSQWLHLFLSDGV